MPVAPRTASALLLAAVTTVAGCDLVARYVSDSPGDQLVDAALARWTAPGEPFLEGASGRDTVASVSPTGARSWEVAVVPPAGGVPAVWSLEIPRVEVYPVFAGDAFIRWLEDRARELGLNTFIPPDLAADVRAGQIRAVGDVDVRYGRAERSGRNTDRHIAYLAPTPAGDRTEWRLQADSRSARVLLQALELVTAEMVRRDDRVLSCMGSASPTGVARDIQLACLTEVLTEEFGG